ncbi:type II toxin-antitoxin system RelE/ParE family toxin [Maricaulaceae bacterium EIL42A08]|nr:type II toxin-antitoxin system RelE/ParE family toxin [Maricaulaceae bacterium EIL42A08]
MKRVEITHEAVEDIQQAFEYSVRTWGLPQAIAYSDELQTAIANLCNHPEASPTVPSIRAGYRRLLIGSHAAYYRVFADRIVVIAVLHVRQDPQTALDQR